MDEPNTASYYKCCASPFVLIQTNQSTVHEDFYIILHLIKSNLRFPKNNILLPAIYVHPEEVLLQFTFLSGLDIFKCFQRLF